MSLIWASAPLAVILLAMGVFRRPAVQSGALGLLVAVALSITVFHPDRTSPDAAAGLLGGAFAEALHSTLTIIWIILPALAIFEFQKSVGALDRIRDVLASLTDERHIQAILIAWFFGLFIEGAAGFGTPVALAAPLLVGLGYDPVRAVVLALLGHAAGVSFGAVGTPALAQVAVSGLPAQEIALRTATLHAVCGPVLLFLMVRAASDTPLTRSRLRLGCRRRDLLLRPVARPCCPYRTGTANPRRRPDRNGVLRRSATASVRGTAASGRSASERPGSLSADPAAGPRHSADCPSSTVSERHRPELEP